jgi:hypothetical protein
VKQLICNNGDSKAHINANMVARLFSRFEVWDWFSVEIRPKLPVPILVENEHLQIWQLLTALLAFLELKRNHLHIIYMFWISRENPATFLMRVCLFKIFGCCHLFFFDNWRAKGACYEKGRFTKYWVLLAGPLFFPWACMRARITLTIQHGSP